MSWDFWKTKISKKLSSWNFSSFSVTPWDLGTLNSGFLRLRRSGGENQGQAPQRGRRSEKQDGVCHGTWSSGAAPVGSNCIPDQGKVQGIVHISLKDIKYHNILYPSEDKVQRRRRWSLSTLAQSTVASTLNVPETSASPGHFKGPLEEGAAAAHLSGEVPLVWVRRGQECC